MNQAQAGGLSSNSLTGLTGLPVVGNEKEALLDTGKLPLDDPTKVAELIFTHLN